MTAPRQSQVPGLTLIDPLHLPPEFRKFKNDDLFYISTCQFYPTGKPGEKDQPKPILRVIAVTPAAIFVTDTFGAMDRATRIEMLDGIYYEHMIVKKFFGTEEAMHVAVKIPKECDIHISFDKGADKDDPFKAATDLRHILEILVAFRSNGRKLNIKDVKAEGKTLKDYVNEKPPEGFMSPKEIIAANAARQAIADKLESVVNESTQLQQAITNLEKLVTKKSKDLAELEQTAGSDLTALRTQRDALVEKNKVLHREHNSAELEIVKLQADVAALKSQLKEETEQREQLIQQEAEGMLKGGDAKQKETEALRKRAQARELEKASEKFQQLKAKLSTPPRYDGPPNLTARALALEEDIQKECDRLERDWEASIKIEKFLDQSVAELREATEKITELHQRKLELLNARAAAAAKEVAMARAAAAPVFPSASAAGSKPSAAGGLADDDDDLLGGPSTTQPKAKAAAPLADDDDDLLGGPSVPAKATAASAAPPAAAGLDDDDLLGGPTTAAAPSAAAPSSGGDDLF